MFGSIYFTFGNSSKVWNGGGEDTVHSKVVAPSPHGFCSAFFFLAKAYKRLIKKTAKPITEIYDPEVVESRVIVHVDRFLVANTIK